MSKLSFLGLHRSNSKKPSSPKATIRSKETHKSSSMRSKSFEPNTDEVRMVFNKFDANGDGKISLQEYMQALRVLGGATTKREAAQTFQAADADGDGFIDLDEFTKLYGSDADAKSSEIQSAFRVFDCDGDGKISAEELMEVLRRMGERPTLEGCKKMIRGVDRDGDGLIDMDEFTNMMKQNIKTA
ncbi:calmodulin-like protein 30 [Salvia miltiorrhiza]|uniref:calmodulin-like protein 30 n=1 Tax=Salvia miltiorrhiza TaxID=226208 RepID=UPI0025AD2787|nr:calmodulin-like protein 30 [Salvia miltiorrhiza]